MEVFHDFSLYTYFAGVLQDLRELGYCNVLSQVLFTDDKACEGQRKLQFCFSLQPLLELLLELLWDKGMGKSHTLCFFKGRNTSCSASLEIPISTPERQGKTYYKLKDKAKCSLTGLQSKKPSPVEPLGLFEMLGSYFIATKANFTTWSATSTYACIVHECRGIWVL